MGGGGAEGMSDRRELGINKVHQMKITVITHAVVNITTKNMLCTTTRPKNLVSSEK